MTLSGGDVEFRLKRIGTRRWGGPPLADGTFVGGRGGLPHKELD